MINHDNVKRTLHYTGCEHMIFRDAEGREILTTKEEDITTKEEGITLPLNGELTIPAKVSVFIKGGVVKYEEAQ
jgi:hypothetical protein